MLVIDGGTIWFEKLEIVVGDGGADIGEEGISMLGGATDELEKRDAVLFDEEESGLEGWRFFCL
jgi:hypothetical protein